MDTTTPVLGLTKPALNSTGWGTKLNTDFDLIDAIFAAAGTGTSVGLNIGSGKTLNTDTAATVKLKGVTLNATIAGLLDNASFASFMTELGITAFAQTVLDDTTQAAARTTLGVGTGDSPQFTAVSVAADPTTGLQLATKQYVDSLAVNVGKRMSVRVTTTANITISTALNNGDTLNGVSLVTGDLVLVKDQSAPAENGIYVVGVSPARDAQFDTFNEHPGSLIAVKEGSVNFDTLWLCTSNDGGSLGSTAITYSKMTVAGELLAANNLSDVSNAATALANLGGQPLDATLTALAGLTVADDAIIVGTGSDAFESITLAANQFIAKGSTGGAVAKSITDDGLSFVALSNAAMLASIGGQPLDTQLSALAALSPAANDLPYFTSASAMALTTLSSFMRTLLDDTTAVAARTTLGVTGEVLLNNQTLGSAANYNFFDSGQWASYKRIHIQLNHVVPATDGAFLWMRTNDDGTSVFDSGASDYSWGVSGIAVGAGTVYTDSDTLDNEMELTGNTAGNGVGNGANEGGLYGDLYIDTETSDFCVVSGELWWTDAGADSISVRFAGKRIQSGPIEAFQFLWSTGNFNSEGTIRVYGVP